MAANKIVLTSNDGESFEMEEAAARKMQIIGAMIQDESADTPIPLQNVTGKILALVVEYCKKHVDDVDLTEEASDEAKVDMEAKRKLETWDKEFMKNMDLEKFFNLIHAANYLNVKALLDLTCQAVADYIKDKEVHEVREIFNIENYFTPEEEEALCKENAWAFVKDPQP